MEKKYKVMSVADIIDKSFRMTISNLKNYIRLYLRFIPVMLIILAVLLVLSAAVFVPLSFSNMLTLEEIVGNPLYFLQSSSSFGAMIFKTSVSIFFFIAYFVVIILSLKYYGASIDLIIKDFTGDRWDMKESLRFAGTKIVTMIGSGFLASFIVIAGIIFCCIGIIPALVFVSLVFPAIIYENADAVSSISRSFKLVSYNFFPILGAWLIFIIIYYGISFLISIIGSVPMSILGTISQTSDNSFYTAMLAIVGLILFCIQIPIAMVLNCFYMSYTTCIFFNQKIKYENWGIESMIENMITEVNDDFVNKPPV